MPEGDQGMQPGHRDVAAFLLRLEGQPERLPGRLPARAGARHLRVQHRLVRQHMHRQHHVPGAGGQLARLLIQGPRQRRAPAVQRDPPGAQRQFSGHRTKLAAGFAGSAVLQRWPDALPLLERRREQDGPADGAVPGIQHVGARLPVPDV